jgi:hypothetical protein
MSTNRNLVLAASVTSLAALATALMATLNLQAVAAGRRVVDTAQRTSLQLSIDSPANGEEIPSWTVALVGRVAVEGEPGRQAVDTLLGDRDIAIVPFVRPLTDQTHWWAQEQPVVHGDGTLEGTLSLGDQQGLGVALRFQVVLLALPRNVALRGEKFIDLPPGYATSPQITLKRSM